MGSLPDGRMGALGHFLGLFTLHGDNSTPRLSQVL